MPYTFAQMLSAELYFEPAAIAILTSGGFDVISPFVAVNPATGQPNLAPAKDAQTFVLFEFAGDTGDMMVMQPGSIRDVAVPAGWRGQLRVTHRVSVGDQPVADGVTPGCYKRLLEQRGQIRALFLTPDNPFRAALPQYDILSIALAQPDRAVDRERSINQATEVFDIRFTATDDLPAAE
jgi:hypothetical protein